MHGSVNVNVNDNECLQPAADQPTNKYEMRSQNLKSKSLVVCNVIKFKKQKSLEFLLESWSAARCLLEGCSKLQDQQH